MDPGLLIRWGLKNVQALWVLDFHKQGGDERNIFGSKYFHPQGGGLGPPAPPLDLHCYFHGCHTGVPKHQKKSRSAQQNSILIQKERGFMVIIIIIEYLCWMTLQYNSTDINGVLLTINKYKCTCIQDQTYCVHD